MRVKFLIVGVILLIAVLVYIKTSAFVEPVAKASTSTQQTDSSTSVNPSAQLDLPALPKAVLTPEAPEGAMKGELTLTFKDTEAMEAFLGRARDKIRVLGRIDGLSTLRVRFSDYGELKSLIGDDAEEGFVFPVNIPPVGDSGVQPGAVPLGNQLLAWLGVSENNADWGKGVKVAVLDSGVASSFIFSSVAAQIEIVPYATDPTVLNGHGTAVASTILGSHFLAPGVAPGVDMISIRVANDAGRSDSFLLADGIVKAVDAGADLINISLGGFGDSQIVRNAVEYAKSKGSLIIAAAGNSGLDHVYYPAAIDSVIGVGAVDALGNHLNFSNSGSGVAIAAPGYGVNVAWLDNQLTRVSGTSFSAPIVTGAIAAVMTEAGSTRLSPTQAWVLMQQYLNDGGVAGIDSHLGAGMPDLSRVFQRDVAGVHDAAMASLSLLPPDSKNPYGKVNVLIQNRGTETLINTTVTVNSPSGQALMNITSMQPGGVQSIQVPVTQALIGTTNSFALETQVKVAPGIDDAKPQNDQRSVTYIPIGN